MFLFPGKGSCFKMNKLFFFFLEQSTLGLYLKGKIQTTPQKNNTRFLNKFGLPGAFASIDKVGAKG